MAGAIEIHDLKTRQAGFRTFVEFHLIVPGDMSVEEAHEICDRLEAAVETEVAGAEAAIHVEPHAEAGRGMRIIAPHAGEKAGA
jgi:divalent metal cation (Fe/Co/Zn/Cd) transporter